MDSLVTLRACHVHACRAWMDRKQLNELHPTRTRIYTYIVLGISFRRIIYKLKLVWSSSPYLSISRTAKLSHV